jgi:hypothetical protein
VQKICIKVAKYFTETTENQMLKVLSILKTKGNLKRFITLLLKRIRNLPVSYN